MGRGSTSIAQHTQSPNIAVPPFAAPERLAVTLTAKAATIAAAGCTIRYENGEVILSGELKIEAEWKANEVFASIPTAWAPVRTITRDIISTTNVPKVLYLNSAGELKLTAAAAGETYIFNFSWALT